MYYYRTIYVRKRVNVIIQVNNYVAVIYVCIVGSDACIRGCCRCAVDCVALIDEEHFVTGADDK